jgi:hypothetical protein
VPPATLVRRTLAGVVAGAAATAAIAGVRLVASDSAGSTPTTVLANVQVLQVEQYCRRNPLAGASFLAAFPDTPSAEGWVCQYLDRGEIVSRTLRQSDMDAACRFQVDVGSEAIATDERDPYSWRCTDPSAPARS